MSINETPTSDPIRVKGRGAFLRLDRPKKFDDDGDPRWEATFLLDPADAKGLESIKLVLKTASDIAKKAYQVTQPPLALRRLAASFGLAPNPGADEKDDEIKIAFFKGDKKEYDGYAGMFVVPAHNSKLKPAVANRRGVSVNPGEEQYPYSGSQVLGSITIWAQVGKTQQKYGKRLGVNLRGVQFFADDTPFTQSEVVAEDEFEALEDAPGGEEQGDSPF